MYMYMYVYTVHFVMGCFQEQRDEKGRRGSEKDRGRKKECIEQRREKRCIYMYILTPSPMQGNPTKSSS